MIVHQDDIASALVAGSVSERVGVVDFGVVGLVRSITGLVSADCSAGDWLGSWKRTDLAGQSLWSGEWW